ncbi:MAG TPA: hypothetical protein VF844_15675 [Ktedonobacteraceae bacterium]
MKKEQGETPLRFIAVRVSIFVSVQGETNDDQRLLTAEAFLC